MVEVPIYYVHTGITLEPTYVVLILNKDEGAFKTAMRCSNLWYNT
jgi:hypothetical protein